MKHLTWKLVLPLTIVSFTLFTKWWDVQIDGEQRDILRGFPLPFVCPGWHTSLSLQIFLLELVIDIVVYFAFWFSVIFIATKTVKSFHISNAVTITLLTIAGLFAAILILFATNPDNIYTATRPFEIKVNATGYRFMWQEETRPDYQKLP